MILNALGKIAGNVIYLFLPLLFVAGVTDNLNLLKQLLVLGQHTFSTNRQKPE